MPRGDRTGPLGLGPMTGRRMGYCAGYPVPGFANWWGGRGRGGGGWGRGYRWRNWYYATGIPGWARGWAAPVWPHYYPPYPPAAPVGDDDAETLREQAEYLEEALGEVKKRLADLEAKSEE